MTAGETLGPDDHWTTKRGSLTPRVNHIAKPQRSSKVMLRLAQAAKNE